MPDASGKRYTLEQLAAMSETARIAYLRGLPHKEYSDLMAQSMVETLNAKAVQDNPD